MAHASPLHETHLDRGAFARQYGPDALDIQVVETFGAMELEYAAVRKAAVIIDQPHRGTLEITGDDRHAFLNSMVTNRVENVEPGATIETLWLNRKGRIVAELRLCELGDRMIADVDAHALETARTSLDSYIITEDVTLRDITADAHRLALHGPASIAALNDATDQDDELTLAPGRAATVRVRGHEVIVERRDLTGSPGLELTVPVAAAAEVYDALTPGLDPETGAANNGVRLAGWLAVNTARIEAGRPMLFLDFTPENLPAECGEAFLHAHVDFKKGCYLGQEVVARMYSLGEPKQTLVALRPEGDPPRDPNGHALQPLGGTNVYLEGDDATPIGGVTSSTISPMLGGVPIAFAMMRTKHATEGATVIAPAEGVPMKCSVHRDLTFYAASPSA